MNLKRTLTYVFAAAVFITAALTSSETPMVFLNLHAALIVLGGTISAAAISFRFERIFTLVKVFFLRSFRGHREFNSQVLVQDLMRLAEAYRVNAPNLNQLIQENKDPFVREAMGTLMDEIFTHEELIRVLRTRTASIYLRYHEEAVKFKALSKFPPAFGLMGAVMGMVGVMSDLNRAGGDSTIGPSLALSLIGTLYGIALANIVIVPIAENLLDSAREVKFKNAVITEGVALIMQKKNPILVAEELNSYLLAGERVDWKKTHAVGRAA